MTVLDNIVSVKKSEQNKKNLMVLLGIGGTLIFVLGLWLSAKQKMSAAKKEKENAKKRKREEKDDADRRKPYFEEEEDVY